MGPFVFTCRLASCCAYRHHCHGQTSYVECLDVFQVTYLGAGTLSSSLPCIPRPQKYWNAVELALLGDTVWEYYVRRHAMFPPAGIRRYRQRLASLSSAESQVWLSTHFVWMKQAATYIHLLSPCRGAEWLFSNEFLLTHFFFGDVSSLLRRRGHLASVQARRVHAATLVSQYPTWEPNHTLFWSCYSQYQVQESIV